MLMLSPSKIWYAQSFEIVRAKTANSIAGTIVNLDIRDNLLVVQITINYWLKQGEYLENLLEIQATIPNLKKEDTALKECWSLDKRRVVWEFPPTSSPS